MAYSRSEQETTIVWDEEEKVAHIYTASPLTMRKLDRLCWEHSDTYQCVWTENDAEGRQTAAKYEVRSRLIRFAKPASQARIEAGKRAFGQRTASDNAQM